MKKFFLLFTLPLCCGCIFIPKYHRPEAPVSSQWPSGPYSNAGKSSMAKTADEISWREFIRDPRLQRLIDLALEHNPDLMTAALNVQQVQTQYNLGEAYMFPTVNGTASAQKQHMPGTSDTQVKTTSLYKVGAGVTSYEIDLFGRLRSLKAQALENLLASEAGQRNVQISLIAQVAVQYLMLCELNEQLSLAQQTLHSQQAYYELVKKSYAIGNTSELDVRSIEAQLENVRAKMIGYERQRAQAENALVLLIGTQIPGDLPSPPMISSANFLTDVSEGLPSGLLERRPDILEAEHQLKAANANIGVARAAFFPQLNLTGFAGTASVKLTDLFTGFAWNYIPELTVPIFDFGVNKANLTSAEILKRIEVVQYQKAIQTAFREVADGLAARSTLQKEVQVQEDLVRALQRRYQLADVRYRNGVDSYLSVLTAQQDLYNAQQNLLLARFNRLANLVTLYKALGGGWNSSG